jgi:hypothetical protein
MNSISVKAGEYLSRKLSFPFNFVEVEEIWWYSQWLSWLKILPQIILGGFYDQKLHYPPRITVIK